MMSQETVILEAQGPLARITINNPSHHNALSHDTMWRLGEVLQDLAADRQVRVVVLTGAGDKAFIAGADIHAMQRLSQAQVLDELPRIQRIVADLEDLPQPTIARINGLALGGGTELALACDFRLAADHAVFGLPEVNLGIIPGYGGTQRLPRLVGIAKAKEILFLGEKLSAADALGCGLVNQVLELDQLDQAVDELVQKLLEKPPLSLRFLKEAVNSGMQTDLAGAVRLEGRLFAACFGSEDRVEGVKAFLERRKPSFKGR